MKAQPQFSDLVGKTLVKIEVSENKDTVNIETADGKKYMMAHSQDCCEYVRVYDVCGDLQDLIGSPILKAEESVSCNESPEGVSHEARGDDSFTWTFYILATIKGYVTIRWLGESNGYYSESVDFYEIDKNIN